MKIDIEVNADFTLDGAVRPNYIRWQNGRTFAIDRILDVCRAASLKAGGAGMRYLCNICGKTVVLWNEEGRWFMERR